MFGWSRALGPSRRAGWRVALLLAGLIVGLILAVTGQAARGTDLRGGRSTTLADLIENTAQRNERTAREVSRLRAAVDDLTGTSTSRDVDAVRQVADRLAAAAGTTEVEGPAVEVTLNDAPDGALNRDYPGLPDPAPDDLIVHQQDVQAVVNALWRGGADAMQLMDQRVIATSAVRCVGNTLILQGRVYSPPYVITAIGDVDRLVAALEASPAVQRYRQYVDAYGLGYKVEKRSLVTIPAYTGALDVRYARASD